MIFPFIAGPLLALAPALSPQEPEPQPVIVTGTLWVVEEGERRLPFGGTLQLCYSTYFGTDSVKAELVAGAFHCELPPGAEYPTVGRLVIEGREAACTFAELTDVSDPVEVEASFLREARLRVRLRDTGQELAACLFGEDDYTREVELPYVVSPWPQDCPVFGWRPTSVIRARAPGSAWAEVQVDLIAGGDFWLELVPEAKLEVTVRMPAGMRPLNLSVSRRRGGRWKSFEVVKDGQVFRLDGLPPGGYVIDTSQTGAGLHSGIRRAAFELAGGEEKHIAIDLSEGEPAERAPAAGVLLVDPSWGQPSGELRLQLWSEQAEQGRWTDELFVTPTASPSRPGAYLWDAGTVGVGLHFVSVEPFAWGQSIEVAPGSGPFELRVPPAVALRVRLVDAETRAVLDEDHLAWCATSPNGRLPVPYQGVYREDGLDHFELTVPRGWIRLTTHVEGFAWPPLELAVDATTAEVVVALEPICRVRVSLRDGERIVAFQDGIGPRAFTLDGSEVSSSNGWNGSTITLGIEEPGRYRITVPVIEGYLPPEPIEVEARPRAIVDVEFQLARR